MKKTINGVPVPYELEISELLNMLSSKDMSTFCAACEALSCKTDDRAFRALVPFLNSKDKYKRLCVFKVIYRHPKAVSLEQYLIDRLSSADFLFVRSALRNIINYRISCPSEIIKDAVLHNRSSLYDEFKVLRILDTNEDNYRYLTALLVSVNQSIAQEIIGDILIDRYSSTKGNDLVQLLSCSTNPKLRLRAVFLGKECGIDMSFLSGEPNGHVRKALQEIS